jgi:kynurenine formamidase
MCPPAFFRQLKQSYKIAPGEGRGSSATATSPKPKRTITYNRIIDLTHTLSPDFPSYNGNPDFHIETMKSFDKDGVNVKQWTVREHIGTHIDAPLHFSADGISCDLIPPEELVVPLVIIDIAARAEEHASTALTPDDISAFEAKHGPIPSGSCVAMHSGWARHACTCKYRNADDKGQMHFPGFHVEAAHALLERNVTGLGVDTLSIDNGPTETFPTHYAWLPSGRWAMEGLTNLDQLPPIGATIMLGAPKIAGATGGPTRVFGFA